MAKIHVTPSITATSTARRTWTMGDSSVEECTCGRTIHDCQTSLCRFASSKKLSHVVASKPWRHSLACKLLAPILIKVYVGSGVGEPILSRACPNILSLSDYGEEWLLLTYYVSTCVSWNFVLTRCCTLTWVTKIMMRTISNLHAGRRFPNPGAGVFKLLMFFRIVFVQVWDISAICSKQLKSFCRFFVFGFFLWLIKASGPNWSSLTRVTSAFSFGMFGFYAYEAICFYRKSAKVCVLPLHVITPAPGPGWASGKGFLRSLEKYGKIFGHFPAWKSLEKVFGLLPVVWLKI